MSPTEPLAFDKTTTPRRATGSYAMALANLFINMLDTLSVQAETLGDSTGKLDHLLDL